MLHVPEVVKQPEWHQYELIDAIAYMRWWPRRLHSSAFCDRSKTLLMLPYQSRLAIGDLHAWHPLRLPLSKQQRRHRLQSCRERVYRLCKQDISARQVQQKDWHLWLELFSTVASLQDVVISPTGTIKIISSTHFFQSDYFNDFSEFQYADTETVNINLYL